MLPETRYAKSGGVNIAYQLVGNGPLDLVLVPGWVSNIDLVWEEPTVARLLGRLASFSRLVLFDKRGTGLSDRVSDLPTLETRMDDVRAVMDAVGWQRAALFAYSEGGPMCLLFAATYPDRVTALVLGGSFPRRTRTADYPCGESTQEYMAGLDRLESEWGGDYGIERRSPSLATDSRYRQWWGRYLRASASPAAAATLARMNMEIDVRHVLPAVRVPVLLLHSVHDQSIDVAASRYMAERIPEAKLIELNGLDHVPWGDDRDAIVDEIEEFLTGSRHGVESDRVLATVL